MTQNTAMPDLMLHDSLTRRTVPFEPLDAGHVRVYYCGPTVYDLAHIGNLRAFLSADILVRLLRALYPRVTFVRNITDIDDKISERAAERGISIAALADETIGLLHADLKAARILAPDIEPRATHHIAEMIALIERLIETGHAYAADGHVLFAVSSFAEYGRLSGRNPDELLAGARVEVAPYKRDPGDFVLWKPSTPELPGWDSPWGRGRPGWHIECSAMAERHLGHSFDIHGGGEDLKFPHHENERAQSLCGFPGSGFASIWLHNAMLNVDGEKMSKSLGNFHTIRDILADTPAEALRLLLLGTHYRSVLNFTRSGLDEAKRTLDRFYRAVELAGPDEVGVPAPFLQVLCQDLNTPGAIAVLHQLADRAFAGDVGAAGGLRTAGRLVGVLTDDPDHWFKGECVGGAIERLIEDRNTARAERRFADADAIRAELLAAGVMLEDGPSGTVWRRA